jgi:hypothetical protein
MNQKFTQQELKDFDDEEMKGLNTGKQVLFFLRQFARVYHVEKKLPHALNGIILN